MIKIKIPKSWNDLTHSQMTKIAQLIHRQEPGLRFDKKVFLILAGTRFWQLRKKAITRYILSQVPLSELRQHFEFIYSQNNRTIFLPQITIKGITYYAPKDRLSNVSIDEFSVADDLHSQFRKTQNPEYLYYLMAVLYVTTAQPRPAFDKYDLEDKVKHFKKVPLELLLATELTYFGCKNNLVQRFPKAFPKGAQKPNAKNYGVAKVILQMTKGDLSKLENIKKINTYTFFEQFQDDIIQAKKQDTSWKK